MSLPRTQRLRKTRQFQEVRAARCRASDETLVVFARPNTLGVYRLGLAVSRKVGCAVVRNRWKRLVREAVRLLGPPSDSFGLDLVVSPSLAHRPQEKDGKKGQQRRPRHEPPTFRIVAASLASHLRRIQKRLHIHKN